MAFAALAGAARPAAAQDTSAAPRITSITLDRYNVFDPGDSSWLAHLVNALHVTTRASVIRKEYLFHVGDLYDSAAIAETARNLRAFGVFRDLGIDSTRSDSGVGLHIVTRDGWTTVPDFRFRSTGGSIAYTLALIENNLLGTVTQTELLYQKDPDRSTVVASLHRNRLIAGKIAGTAEFFDRSDGTIFVGQLALPYFATTSPAGGDITVDDSRDRIFRYRDGNLTPLDTVQNRYVLVRGDLSRALHATSFGYLRAGGSALVERDDYISDSLYRAGGFPTASVRGALGGFVELSRVDIPTVRGYQSFGRLEDIDLSTTLGVSAFLAPVAWGYPRTGIAPAVTLHLGRRFRAGFAYADLVANGMYSGRGLDSGQVFASGTLALIPSVRHQLVVHGEAGALRNPLPGTEYDLGLGVGPRAFTQHAFTGDREFFATAEYRYVVSPEFLKVVGVGLAAYVDHGGAWWAGDPVRTGWDYGIGLRLGATRAPDLEVNRLDLAWRAAHDGIPGGWVFSVGKGFVFSTGPRPVAR